MPWKLTWKIRTSCFLLSTCQREAQGAPYPFSPSYKGGINIMRKEKVKCFKGTVWSNHGWSECSRCRGWFCLAPFDRWYSKEGTHLLRPDQVFHHITRAVVDVLLFSKCLFCWNWGSIFTSTLLALLAATPQNIIAKQKYITDNITLFSIKCFVSDCTNELFTNVLIFLWNKFVLCLYFDNRFMIESLNKCFKSCLIFAGDHWLSLSSGRF